MLLNHINVKYAQICKAKLMTLCCSLRHRTGMPQWYLHGGLSVRKVACMYDNCHRIYKKIF